MSTTTERIGFIGLGFMGHGMAKNVREAGYEVTVLGNRNRKPVEDMVARGAVEASNSREVGERSDIVMMCLPGSPQVEAVVRGENGLREGLASGSVIIDSTTADPVSTAAIADELAKKGVDFVDAPLSRTPKEAWEGTLDMMVGAKDQVLERVRPVLEVCTQRFTHIGGVGDGHRMKLLNNFLSMGYASIYAEALTLANKVGIAPETFHSVINGSRMDCGFYQTFMGYLIEGNREAHKFTLTNGLKDLRYLGSMADSVGLVNPVGAAAKNTLAAAVASGADGPEDYVPHLPEHIGRLNGTTLKPTKG
ncbi:MAG: NAD(P)-dependent oxidoreductase [Pseudomonadota bacterium]